MCVDTGCVVAYNTGGGIDFDIELRKVTNRVSKRVILWAVARPGKVDTIAAYRKVAGQ